VQQRFVISSDRSLQEKTDDDDEELRLESDEEGDGGCHDGNEDIMDLEDMGDYIESSSPTKVASLSGDR
jgi:hypothetical protein